MKGIEETGRYTVPIRLETLYIHNKFEAIATLQPHRQFFKTFSPTCSANDFLTYMSFIILSLFQKFPFEILPSVPSIVDFQSFS